MGLNYNPTIVPDGLIVYLDPANSRSYSGSGNTWYDISGNSLNASLVNTPSYTVSNRGTFILDGSSNYFTLPNNSILSLSEFTISIWVKVLQLNADQYLVDTSSNLNFGYGYSFRIRSNNTIRFWAYDANTLVETTETVSSNLWYHITVSYSNFSKTQRIYINGSLSASAQHTNAFVLADPQYLRIGHSQVLGGYSKAVIGQSMFYNRELSASEIKQNYDSSKGRYITPENIVTKDLAVYYNVSESSSYSGIGNTIFDLSGSGNTGALTNGPTFSAFNGGSLVLDGSNDYVLVNNAANILSKTEYTKIAYVYFTSFSTSNNIISGGFSGQHAFWLFGSNRLYAGHNGAWSQVTGATTLSLNTWYFGAVTYSSTTGWKLYLNGVQDGSNGDTTTFTGNQEISIGSYSTGNNFTGRIGSAFVYNRALSATEIQQNYNATKGRFGL